MLIALSVACALAVSACDGHHTDTTTDSVTDGGAGPATTSRPPNQGCTEDYPNRLTNTGPLADTFTTCSTDDGASLQLTNTTSALVLSVRAGSQDAPELTVLSSAAPSFAESAVNAAVPLGCGGSSTGPCLLTPNGTLTAVAASGVPVALLIDAAKNATVTATAANSLAGYVAGKFTPRAQQFTMRISKCAQASGAAAAQHQYAADAIRDSVSASIDCRSLINYVALQVNERPPPTTTATEEILTHVGSYTADLHRDFTVYGAVEVLSHLRR